MKMALQPASDADEDSVDGWMRREAVSLEHLYREASAEFQVALAISPASTIVRAALKALEGHV